MPRLVRTLLAVLALGVACSPVVADAATPTAAGTLANTFGQNIFGVAAGGSLQSEDSTTLAHDLSVDQSVGARWLRTDINWAQIQSGGPSSYNWKAIDSVVTGAESRGLSVLGVIVFTPAWDRPSGTSSWYAPSPSSYAKFAATAVQHYSALGVHAYEIWNEPNIYNAWKPAPDPAAYTALLKAAYPAVKRADPTATVLTGGTSPASTDGRNYSPVAFLSDIYANGGKGYFDAVGQHPYCWPAYPGATDTWSTWYQTYGTTPSLRSVMIANGDGPKKIWGTEFGAPTNGPSGASFVSATTQAAMISKAYQLWSNYGWAGPLFVYQSRDQGTATTSTFNFMGMVDYNFNAKPSYAAYQQATALY